MKWENDELEIIEMLELNSDRQPLVILSDSKSFTLPVNNGLPTEDFYIKSINKIIFKSYILNIITFGCCYQLLKQKYANKIKILKKELKTLRIINKEKCDNENDIIAKAEIVISNNTETSYLKNMEHSTSQMPKVKTSQLNQSYHAINYLAVNNEQQPLNPSKKLKLVFNG